MLKQTGSRPVQWLLLTGNRLTVTAVMLAATFALFVLLGAWGPPAVQQLTDETVIQYLFSSMVGAVVTTVTLVLTISQFTLSQNLAHLGSFRERMSNAIEFRRDVEEKTGVGVSPAYPLSFFRALARGVEGKLDRLADALPADDVPEITDFIEVAREYSQRERRRAKEARYNTFSGVLPILNHDYSWKILLARQLRHEHRDALPGAAMEAFDDLLKTLQFFGPTREYFKTLYFQDEVVRVSRVLLYTALPVLALSGYMVVMFDPSTVSMWLGARQVAGMNSAFLLIGVAFVLSLVPFTLLLAYLLRMLTVLRRTLAIGPFILRESQLPQEE